MEKAVRTWGGASLAPSLLNLLDQGIHPSARLHEAVQMIVLAQVFEQCQNRRCNASREYPITDAVAPQGSGGGVLGEIAQDTRRENIQRPWNFPVEVLIKGWDVSLRVAWTSGDQNGPSAFLRKALIPL